MTIKRHYILLWFVLSTLTVWGERGIVPSEVSKMPEYALAASFLQGYANLLDSPQTTEVSDRIRRTKEDGFKYIMGTDNGFRQLSGREEFSISFSNGGYSASWSDCGKTKVEVSFPANIGLMTFSNKVDLEKRMIEKLSAVAESTPSQMQLIVLRESLSEISYSDYLLKDNGFYLIPRLKNQLVYKSIESSDSCALLIDNNRYAPESIANVLLSGYSPQPLMVNVRIRQYGYKSQELEIPFSALYSLLSENGSTPYWGIESFDGKEAKGLYVWQNTYGGYNHMLTLTIPTTIITEPTTINATLHCYIRTDNLKSLFEDYPRI